MRRLAKGRLGETLLGHLDYYRFPERRNVWGGPFNGQKARVALFLALMRRCSPSAIIETGTYLGTTTELLSEFGCPVYTIEDHPRSYGFARARLRKRRNVTLLRGDTRKALRQLFDGPLDSLVGGTLFFYLDAHWKADLPLAEELKLVFDRCLAAMVMVDDFQVPGDPGYGFDDYGQGKALTPDYIAPVVAAHGLTAFYPATPASEESGARRGCVVLVRRSVYGEAFASLSLLRSIGDMPTESVS